MKIRFVRGYPVIAEIEPKDLVMRMPEGETDPRDIERYCSPSVLQVAYRCSYALYGSVFLKNRSGPLGLDHAAADLLTSSSDEELDSGSWTRAL